MRRLALVALLLTGCAHDSAQLVANVAVLVAEVALINAAQNARPSPPPRCSDGDPDDDAPPCPPELPPPPPDDDSAEPGR